MTKTMKKLTVITALLVASYSVNANAKTYYVGISSQKNGLHFNEGYDSINDMGYNKTSREFSGFIGYEFDQSDSSPYQLSIETSYFADKNSRNSVDFDSDIKTSILSLNTINNFHIHKRVSIIGIAGLSYANFKFNERDTIGDYNSSNTEDGLGINWGIGVSFHPANLEKVSVRATVVRSIFYNIIPDVDSINKINGMTAISIDFRYDF